MTDPKLHPKRRKGPRRLYLVGLIVLAIGAVWYAHFRWSLHRRLTQQFQWLESRGYPVTLTQLNDWYVLPEGADNAADLYLEAFACVVEWSREDMKLLPVLGSGVLPEPNEPPDKEICALMQDYLTDNAESLEWLAQAARLEHARYPIDFREGLTPAMPWLRDIRRCVRLYGVQIMLAIETGDTSAFMESFSGASGLARSLSQMPAQIGQQVRIACTALLCGSLEHGLSCLTFTDEQLIHLYGLLESPKDVTLLIRGAAGELCLLADFIRFSESFVEDYMGRDSRIPGLMIKPYRVLGLAQRDVSDYLSLAQDMFSDPTPNTGAFLESTRAMEQHRKTIPRTHWLVHRLSPAWERNNQLYMRFNVGLDSAQMALAVLRYRLQHQRLPDSLTELVPEFVDAVPIDPFAGQALQYRRQAKGFVIYSVGVDGQNNGGIERDKKDRDRNHDIPFAVNFSARAH
jgi:hypothetical protein